MARTIISEEQRAAAPRATELRMARISNPDDWDGLTDLIGDLWRIPSRDLDVASIDRIAKLGSDPLRNPSIVAGEYSAEGGTRTVLFRLPNTQVWVLYALGSATLDDGDDGDNVFTSVLSDVLRRLRPRRVVSPTFDRLVRSLDHASAIWKTLRANVEVLDMESRRIRMGHPNAEAQFVMEVMFSMADIAALRRRMLNGRVRHWRDGRCPLKADQVPLGYRLDSDHRAVVHLPDRPIIRAILEGLSQDLSPAEIVERAARLGGSSPGLRRLYGPDATFADARNKAELVRSWRSWLQLWEEGRFDYVFTMRTTIGIDATGFDLFDAGPDETRLIVPQHWGLPEGGWAEPWLFEACRKHALPRKHTSRRGIRRQRMPFTGRSWSSETEEWKIFSENDSYRLRRRPKAKRSQVGWGRKPHMDGEEVARVRASDLHRHVAESIAQALEDGIDGQRIEMSLEHLPLPASIINEPAQRAATLLRNIDSLNRQLANFTAAIAHASEERTRNVLTERVDTISRDLTELETDLKRAQHTAATTEPDSQQTTSLVFEAIGYLAEVKDRAAWQLERALQLIMPDFQIVQTTADTITWQSHVDLPTAGATLRIGPIVATVPAYTRKARTPVAAREHELLANFMTSNLTITELAAADGRKSTEVYERVLHTALKRYGYPTQARTLILNRYIPTSALQALWRHHNDVEDPTDQDPAWEKKIVATYTNNPGPFPSPTGLANTTTIRQTICDYLIAHGGTAPQQDILTDLADAGVTPTRLQAATTTRKSSEPTRTDRARTAELRPDGTIGIVPCPHCNGHASFVSLLPETPQGLICPTCRRTPDPDSPIYPPDYLRRAWLRNKPDPAPSNTCPANTTPSPASKEPTSSEPHTTNRIGTTPSKP